MRPMNDWDRWIIVCLFLLFSFVGGLAATMISANTERCKAVLAANLDAGSKAVLADRVCTP